MKTATESSVGLETNRSESLPAPSASAPEVTESVCEAIADANQQIFSNLLEALLQDPDEDENEEDESPDDVAPYEIAHIAVNGCEKLTNEIMRLEKLRQSVAQLHAQHNEDAGTLKHLLQSLLEAYDRKIRDCEDRLDRSLERYRKSTPSCGILADYYLG